MRFATILAALVLVGCAPRPECPKLAAPPAPTAEDFAACGGLVYHAPPGDVVPYTLRFRDTVSDAFGLHELCILLDGLPIHTRTEAEGFVARARKHETPGWEGRVFPARHIVRVQAVYQGKEQTITIRSAIEIATRTGGALEITALEHGGASTPLAERLTMKLDVQQDQDERCE